MSRNRSKSVTITQGELDDLIAIAAGAAAGARDEESIRAIYVPIADKYGSDPQAYGVAREWKGRVHGHQA